MPRIYFITHPEVQFDWNLPVPQWDLSDAGRVRLEKLARQPWVPTLAALFSSQEQKAITTAKRLAQINHAPIEYLAELGEIDRSAAGILPPDQYSQVTDAFFANPDQSARGWETAHHAQSRILAALTTVLTLAPDDKNLAIISHGGVGTLLLCRLLKLPIARQYDQPSQGHYFVFDSTTLAVEHGWKPIDGVPA